MDIMTMTTHVAVGTAIGLAVHNPALGFALGFCTHFLLDTIPHGDSAISAQHFGKKKSIGPYAYVAIDNTCAIYLLLFLVNLTPQSALLSLSAGVAGSILPDVFVGVYEASRRKWMKSFFAFHMRIHNTFTNRVGDIPLAAGVLYQMVFIFFLLSISL